MRIESSRVVMPRYSTSAAWRLVGSYSNRVGVSQMMSSQSPKPKVVRPPISGFT